MEIRKYSMENRRDREHKKQRLRERMIDSETFVPDEEELARYRENRRKHRQARAIVIVLVIAFAAAGVLGYRYYRAHHKYSEVTVTWEKEISGGSFSGYEAYGDNVIKYTRDGASYINKKGEAVWSQAFEMKSPFAEVSGDFAAIADRNGYSIYICDKNGCQGVVTTTLPISRVAISSTGITVAILEDTKSNIIAFYDKAGKKLQIEVQTTLAGNGYPIDLSISPDGMMLMVSYVYLDEGLMQNQVVFYNFDEEGQNIKDRLVGGFKEYGSSMVARVRFLDDTYACAFAEDRICFYSLENTVKPELVKQIDISGEISSIFYSSSYAGAVVRDESGSRTMTLYGKNGSESFSQELDTEYDHVELSGSHVLLYRETECMIYSAAGNLKYQGSLESTIDKLICLSDSRYIQIGPQAMRGIELK